MPLWCADTEAEAEVCEVQEREEMKTEVRKIDELLPDPNNINRHTQRGHGLVENSIRRRGVGRGILAAGKNTDKPVIMAGNLTHEKARDAGIEEVVFVHTTGNQLVVTVRDDLDPTSPEAIALGIEDNEIGRLSYAPDIDVLAAMSAGDSAILAETRKQDKVFNDILEGMGIKNAEPVDAEPQIDRAAELQEKWQTKSGQLWKLGDHRLLIGDCTVRENVERLMGGERAELLFTSPPYADAREYGGDDLSIEKLSLFFSSFLSSIDLFAVNLGILRKDNEIVCYWDKYIEAAKREGLKFLSWNIWNRETAQSIAQQTAMFPIEHEFIFIFGKDKGKLNKTIPNKHAGAHVGITDRQTDGSLKRRDSKLVGEFRALGTVFTSPPHKGVDIGHPAMFPVSFAEAYINACTKTGGGVAEPFAGSGTTIIAAHNLNRRCFAMEISEKYGAVILERFYTATGITPELVTE